MNRSQFSFGLAVLPVSVTEQDIEDGIARNCNSCAIARALNRTLPRLGFKECFVRLVPYAAFMDADGLEILSHFPRKHIGCIPPRDLPAGLIEWAMDFDNWAEWSDSGESRAAWEKRTGDYPFRPSPITFVFNFGKLQPSNQ